MKTENIVILKNLHNYDDFAGADYLVAAKSEVIDGYLHDTYNDYGVALDEYESSDYCLANTESNMDSEISCAIMQSEDFRPYLNKVMVKENDELFNPQNDEDFQQWFDSAVKVNSDGTVEVNGEENEVLSAYAEKYNEDHAVYTGATYINYWDGHNHQTLVISADSLDYDAFDIVTEENEEYADLMNILEKFDTYIANGVCKTETIGDYEISNSLYESDHFITISKK